VDVPPRDGRFRDLAPALAALPLFPLEAVLFPDAVMPLHVFEPRYRAMVRDALATHRALAVVLVTDPRPIDEHGHPSIAGVATAGTILDHAELPGGRFNILLRGRARVRLDELPFVPPYRRARAEVMEDTGAEPTSNDLSALLSTATSFASLVRARDPSFELRLPRGLSAARMASLCASQLVLDTRERQAILETLDVGERVRRVTEAIAVQRLALSSLPGEAN
jgi:ATP-dependent Lon protease